MYQIRGQIAKDLKRDAERGTLFALVRYESPHGLIDAKMSVRSTDLRVGDYFVADGDWKAQSYKGQDSEVFYAKSARPDLPRSVEAAAKWFSTIFQSDRHGVTPASAAAFAKKLGPNVAALCEASPELLVGLSPKPQLHRDAILHDWGRRVSGRRAVRLLESSGVPRKAIDAILDAFKDSSWEILDRDPYLAARVKEVGFGNADKIGRKVGIAADDARRVSAALVESLEEFRREGHTYATLTPIGERLRDHYGIAVETAVEYVVGKLNARDTPFVIDQKDGDFIAQLRPFFEGEAVIARSVTAMLASGRRLSEAAVDRAAERLLQDKKFAHFDDVQKAAAKLAAREPFSILTGGPGTGKSTVSELVVRLVEDLDGGQILLCAPTGKAAKRLEETTRKPVRTIHSMLEAVENKAKGTTEFKRNRNNTLPKGCFVLVDEASMIDVPTMRALMEAMPPDGRIVLVGDRNQLPSVDAGAVLGDLLQATDAVGNRIVPSAELIKVYRQDERSRIATGAAEVRSGHLPALSNQFVGGLALYEHVPEQIVARVKWCVEACRKTFKLQAHEFVVLVPQAPGVGGAWEINAALSKVLNPHGRPIQGVSRGPSEADRGAPLPRVGDRVMLTENDAEKDVMNGEVGTIVDAVERQVGSGPARTFIKVAFDSGKEVEFPAARWRSLILAYAVTIHKSQGSQYHTVIMPVTSAHANMLDRSLLYTGWTRAKQSLLLVGDREALQKSIDTVESSKRQTRLREFISRAAADLGLRGRNEPATAAVAPAPARVPPPVRMAPPARMPPPRVPPPVPPRVPSPPPPRPASPVATDRDAVTAGGTATPPPPQPRPAPPRPIPRMRPPPPAIRPPVQEAEEAAPSPGP